MHIRSGFLQERAQIVDNLAAAVLHCEHGSKPHHTVEGSRGYDRKVMSWGECPVHHRDQCGGDHYRLFVVFQPRGAALDAPGVLAVVDTVSGHRSGRLQLP